MIVTLRTIDKIEFDRLVTDDKISEDNAKLCKNILDQSIEVKGLYDNDILLDDDKILPIQVVDEKSFPYYKVKSKQKIAEMMAANNINYDKEMLKALEPMYDQVGQLTGLSARFDLVRLSISMQWLKQGWVDVVKQNLNDKLAGFLN